MPASRCELPDYVLEDDKPPRRNKRQLVNEDDGCVGELLSDEDVALDGHQNALLWQLRNADAQELVQGVAVNHFGRRRRPRYNTHAVRPVEAPRVGNGALHDGRLAAASPSKQPNVLALQKALPGRLLRDVEVERHSGRDDGPRKGTKAPTKRGRKGKPESVA